jgi:hypothetical protein
MFFLDGMLSDRAPVFRLVFVPVVAFVAGISKTRNSPWPVGVLVARGHALMCS